MKKVITVIFAILSLNVPSIAAAGPKIEDVNQSVQNKVIKINLLKTKDKYKKGRFDFAVEIGNLSGKSLVFYYGEMTCSRDGQKGRLDYPFFGAGERSIDLKPGEFKRFNYTCKTERRKEPAEVFELSIGRIFENPNNDGLTSGKLLSNGLMMKVEFEED